MASTYDAEEAEEWLAKVNSVKQTIESLTKGRPNALKDADDLLNKFAKDKIKKVKKKKKASEPKIFQKGDGWSNQYKFYCNGCFSEILIKTNKCPNCNYRKLVQFKTSFVKNRQ